MNLIGDPLVNIMYMWIPLQLWKCQPGLPAYRHSVEGLTVANAWVPLSGKGFLCRSLWFEGRPFGFATLRFQTQEFASRVAGRPSRGLGLEAAGAQELGRRVRGCGVCLTIKAAKWASVSFWYPLEAKPELGFCQKNGATLLQTEYRCLDL